MSSNKYDGVSDEELEKRIRRATLERGLDLLSGGKEIPAGQLIALIGKLGVGDDAPEDDEGPKASAMDLFEVLPGLPPDRQKEILDEFQAKLAKARGESNG